MLAALAEPACTDLAASFLLGEAEEPGGISEKVTCSGEAGVPVLRGGPLAVPATPPPHQRGQEGGSIDSIARLSRS